MSEAGAIDGQAFARERSRVSGHLVIAALPAFAMVRVMPLATQVATNDARHYPVYQVCEELGIPVGINVGIPGPRVPMACTLAGTTWRRRMRAVCSDPMPSSG